MTQADTTAQGGLDRSSGRPGRVADRYPRGRRDPGGRARTPRTPPASTPTATSAWSTRAWRSACRSSSCCPGSCCSGRGCSRLPPAAPAPSVRRYAWHRVRRIMPAYVITVLVATSLPLPHGRAQSRPHLDRAVPQPHADADLHRQLPLLLPAPGADPDVEPRRRGRVLRGAAAAGLPAAGGAVPDGGGGRGCCLSVSPHWR